jgi:hypothetical protein
MPRIGDMKLKQLTGPALNRLYGQLLAPGANLRSPKRGLSPRTVPVHPHRPSIGH